MTEALPSALEPELRRIIDTAVARVAAIELEAIREARQLTQRSEQEAREALRFALDRAFNLINTLELLAATVGGMAEALKIELDDAIAALRSVPEPESALARELTQPPAQQELPVPDPEPESAAPAAPQAPAPPPPQPAALPAPEPAQPEAQQPAPEPTAPAEPEPPQPEAPQAEAEQRDADRAAAGNGYAPAERQAESLAKAAAREPQDAPEPPAASEEAERGPAVPTRRRGLVRRLFTK